MKTDHILNQILENTKGISPLNFPTTSWEMLHQLALVVKDQAQRIHQLERAVDELKQKHSDLS